jgi:hypothetical protein
VLPTGGATENFDVISVVPANNLAVVASAPIVTSIVPVFEFETTEGAKAGATLSKPYVCLLDWGERFPAASAAFAVTLDTLPLNFDVGMNVTFLPALTALKLDVMSSPPENRFAVVASAPIVATITPVVGSTVTVGAATGALLSKVYVFEADDADRLPAASAAFAVIARLAYSTSPKLGVNVTVLPVGATENFDVMSVLPSNSLAVVASAPIVTTIVPVFESGANVGALEGATLSNKYTMGSEAIELPAAPTAFEVTFKELPSNFDVEIGVNVTVFESVFTALKFEVMSALPA